MSGPAGIDDYLAALACHLRSARGSDAASGPAIIHPVDESDLLVQVKESLGRAATDVVVVTENAWTPSGALAVLLGDAPPDGAGCNRVPWPSVGRLDALLAPLGLRPTSNVLLPGADRPRDGILGLLTDLSLRAGFPGDTPYLARRYQREEPVPGRESGISPGSPAPALSVLVRTQGNRPQALADALLSLAGQTCQDFEVLLLCHKASEDVLDGIRNVVASFHPSFSTRIRVIDVTGPGRAAPLNAGVLAAGGRHVAFLDDDDVVLGHWVECFVTAAAEHPTSVLRARVAEQDLERIGTLAPGFRAASQTRSPWNGDFDLLDHWVDNHSPINGYACPVEAFRRFGFRFDERLPVLEDWHLLLQVASVCGVVSIPEFTSAPKVEEFHALEDVNLTIPRGTTFGLVGHNGSGKSTLLKLVAGIFPPTSGRIRASGRVTALLELGAGFHPDLTGRENVFLSASIHGVGQREVRRRVESTKEFSGLGDFFEAPVKTYSSGMFVRLGFAVSVHLDPDILIIDEVVAVGDEQFQRQCFDHLHKLRREGTTILFVSHSLAVVEQLAHEAAWIDHGHVRATGSARDVIDAYLGQVNKDERERQSVGASGGVALPVGAADPVVHGPSRVGARGGVA